MIDEDLEWLINRSKEFENVLHSTFKNLRLNGGGSSGPDFQAYISTLNKDFEGTEYFYTGEKVFFHLTSISNLLSIINSQSFRLYNLNSSKDPDEYDFGSKLLNISEEWSKYFKTQLFTLSFCPISELFNKKVWQKIGGNFKNVALVFELVNDPSCWINYHLSLVKYQKPLHFETYSEQVAALEKKYAIRLHCDLSRLIGFHKKESWKHEKEVRLVTYNPYPDPEDRLCLTKPEFRVDQTRNRITSYVELPIWIEPEAPRLKQLTSKLRKPQNVPDGFFNSAPKIRINKLIFGKNCGIKADELDNFSRTIMDTFLFNWGYNIEIDPNLFSL